MGNYVEVVSKLPPMITLTFLHLRNRCHDSLDQAHVSVWEYVACLLSAKDKIKKQIKDLI